MGGGHGGETHGRKAREVWGKMKETEVVGEAQSVRSMLGVEEDRKPRF